jgi:hypothetical protein
LEEDLAEDQDPFGDPTEDRDEEPDISGPEIPNPVTTGSGKPRRTRRCCACVALAPSRVEGNRLKKVDGSIVW